MFAEKDIVRIAKRENNNKRKYLVVNRLQAKHIPVSPQKALSMFDRLADVVSRSYGGESVLLIGFAETATAIGARVAINLNGYYMQTTRENMAGVEYLFFTESHSHATEQKLVQDDLADYIDKVQRIIFIEDEVTTGNTILNITNIIEKKYPGKVSFSVASLLNGMDEEALKIYSRRGIKIHYLVKTNHSTYPDQAESFKGDGHYYKNGAGHAGSSIVCKPVHDYIDSRRIVQGKEYAQACKRLWKQIEEDLDYDSFHDILVLGTEEFMYPAIYVGSRLEESGKNVKCHSTTRSPITVSSEEEYPVHSRYELTSMYDDHRTIFIYDICRYDCVLVITDANHKSQKGIDSLVHAIQLCGNTNIFLYRWC